MERSWCEETGAAVRSTFCPPLRAPQRQYRRDYEPPLCTMDLPHGASWDLDNSKQLVCKLASLCMFRSEVSVVRPWPASEGERRCRLPHTTRARPRERKMRSIDVTRAYLSNGSSFFFVPRRSTCEKHKRQSSSLSTFDPSVVD